MKILICVDELPFPPRNGVTIPSAAYIKLLAKKHSVDCVYLKDIQIKKSDENYQATLSEVAELFEITRIKKSKLSQICSELFLGKMACHSWWYPDDNKAIGLVFSKYDVVIGTPISTLDFCFRFTNGKQRVVAAISDSYTSVLSNAVYLNESYGFTKAIKKIRVSLMAHIERRVLSCCSSIIVQTNRDVEWMHKIGGDTLKSKTFAISNGVSNELLELPLINVKPDPILLFAISSFSDPLYRKNLKWFCTEIWPSIKKVIPSVRLRITGKGLDVDSDLFVLLTNDDQIDLIGYMPNLIDVYSGVRVALAPIYKSYGYINKVAEAFAVGVPVVGDISAFNGLETSVDRSFVVVCENIDDYINSIVKYLVEDDFWLNASTDARLFASKNLTWTDRLPKLMNAITR